MSNDSQARWIHFEDAPVGEAEKDRFAEFRKPLADFGAENLDISLVEVAPGETGPMHAHGGSVEECYVVLSGEVDVELAEETVRGRPGSVFFFPPDAVHRPFNDSEETARFASIRSGEGERTVLD